MYPNGYGNPHNMYPAEEPPHSSQHQHNMMQDPHADIVRHRVQQYPPEYNSSSFHYPPAHRPPYDDPRPDAPPRPYPPQFPYDNLRPDPPPPPYPPPFPSFYPPQPINDSFYAFPPPHTAPYPPQCGLPHVSSFEEHSHLRPTFEIAHHNPLPHHTGHSHPSSEHLNAHPTFEIAHHTPLPHQSSSFPHRTSSFQEDEPWILEGGSVALNAASPSPYIEDPPLDVELPKGQIVRVFCKSSRSYNLAVRNGRLMMVKADSGSESQQWIRDNKYSIRVRDSFGHPAFMLINKASKKVLKHAKGKLQEAQLIDYSPDIQDDDLFWTESQDFGEGFKTLRMASDTLLNLTAGHDNGSSIILDTWHKKDNQLWKIFPL